MTRKERRKLGLTFKKIRKTVRKLKAAGDLDGMDNAAIAATVMDRLAADNPKLLGIKDFDWDALLAFIEKLLPIILQLIAIFGA